MNKNTFNIVNSVYSSLLKHFAASLKGIPNYGMVGKGLSRSAQPSKQGLEHLKSLNIDAIVKLNRNEEFSVENEEEYFGGKVLYKPLNLKDLTKADGLRIAAIINEELNKGNRVHVHCTYGRDRTGLITGIWKLKYKGSTLASLKADWKTYGDPAPKVKKILEDLSEELSPK